MPTNLRRERLKEDDGVTLVEMLVVTIIFTIILAIITTAIIKMMGDTQRANGQRDDADAARKVIEMLDHQVRYANAVSTPGTGTDSNLYVEWRTGNTGQQQTCTQWRYVATGGKLQWRTWLPPLAGNGAATGLTTWATAATGFSKDGTNNVFSITPLLNGRTSAQQTAAAAANTHQQLTVDFRAVGGVKNTNSVSQVTLTAINTLNATATPVCTEVGRP